MAKAAFISLYDESAYGIRLLSACLKKTGHQRHIIFLKGYNNSCKRSEVTLYDGEIPWEGIGRNGDSFVYALGRDITDREKVILIDLLKNIKPDFIGLTVNTPLKWRAILISKLIKKLLPDILLVWGGFEATINPKESLQYCDVVCRGEAEYTIVELAKAIDKNNDIKGIKNLCFKRDGRLIESGINPPCQNLDELPFQDHSFEGNFFIEFDKLQESPKFLFPAPNIYSTIAARGCMFQCTYCCELYLKDFYSPHAFLRRRSPENVIEELKEVKNQCDIKHIIFQDEILASQMDWLKKFAPLYNENIGLPFTAYVFPSKNFEKRIKVLKDAGLSYTCLAVQSGSKSISKLYKRPFNRMLFLKAARILRSMDIGFYTDIITYNPLEKKEDLEDTLDILLEIPQPYDLCINKLYVLPGTELFEQLVGNEIDKKNLAVFDYYSALFRISSYFKSSRILIKIIKAVRIFSSYPVLLKPILYATSLLGSLNTSLYFLGRIKRSGGLNFKFFVNTIMRKLKLL